MQALSALILVCGLVAAGPAVAQWQWIDAGGKKVFSDRPPPIDVPDRNILKRPPGRAAPLKAAPAAGQPASAPGQAVPKLSGSDKELEERRQQAEAAEAARRKAEQEASARARADNCARARQAKSNYDSGIRIARVNAQGEREIINDATRAAETQRLQEIISSDCA